MQNLGLKLKGKNLEATKEMISMAIVLHVSFIVGMLIIIAWQLLALSKEKFRDIALWYERRTLYYRAFIASVAFTGVAVMAVEQFEVRWMVYTMVAVTLHLLANTIIENIRYKSTNPRSDEDLEKFRLYAKKKYTIDLVVVVVMLVLSYAVPI